MITQIFDNLAGPAVLLRVIVRDFDYQTSYGLEPAAERWTTQAKRRQELCDRIEDSWRRAVNGVTEGSRATMVFPWSLDFIVSLWIAFRKSAESEKQLMRREFGLPEIVVKGGGGKVSSRKPLS